MGKLSGDFIDGYEEFEKYTKDLKEPVVFYFSGKKDENGVSWCPDCQEAEPIIKKVLDKLSNKPKFVRVDVGDRATFKDLKCPFRLNKDVHIQVIPTLLKWKTVQRLENDQCLNENLLEMFFTEDDE